MQGSPETAELLCVGCVWLRGGWQGAGGGEQRGERGRHFCGSGTRPSNATAVFAVRARLQDVPDPAPFISTPQPGELLARHVPEDVALSEPSRRPPHHPAYERGVCRSIRHRDPQSGPRYGYGPRGLRSLLTSPGSATIRGSFQRPSPPLPAHTSKCRSNGWSRSLRSRLLDTHRPWADNLCSRWCSRG
jgi:hypothetical protein